MRTTQQLSITLPNEMAEFVKAKVQSGEYASDSEVLRDGLRTLMARDAAVEKWLREVAMPTYRRVKAGEEETFTGEQVLEQLRLAREGRLRRPGLRVDVG